MGKRAAPGPAQPQAQAGGQPLELVRYDEKTKKFEIGEEALAVLRKFRSPMGVVSVCGRARQGKSFILNQLLGRSSGFVVAPTHRPCTKGLWMWSSPVEQIGPDGSKHYLVCCDSCCRALQKAMYSREKGGSRAQTDAPASRACCRLCFLLLKLLLSAASELGLLCAQTSLSLMSHYLVLPRRHVAGGHSASAARTGASVVLSLRWQARSGCCRSCWTQRALTHGIRPDSTASRYSHLPFSCPACLYTIRWVASTKLRSISCRSLLR